MKNKTNIEKKTLEIKIEDFYVKKNMFNYDDYVFFFIRFNSFNFSNLKNFIKVLLKDSVISNFYHNKELNFVVPTIFIQKKQQIIKKIMYKNLLLCYINKKKDFSVTKIQEYLKKYGKILQRHLTKQNILSIFNKSINKNTVIDIYKKQKYNNKQKVHFLNNKNLILVRKGPFTNCSGYLFKKFNDRVILTLRLFKNKIINVEIFNEEL